MKRYDDTFYFFSFSELEYYYIEEFEKIIYYF